MFYSSLHLQYRRERNRMHAKMTRDRKKCFVASIKRVITRLENENQSLRSLLDRSRAAAPDDTVHEEQNVVHRQYSPSLMTFASPDAKSNERKANPFYAVG